MALLQLNLSLLRLLFHCFQVPTKSGYKNQVFDFTRKARIATSKISCSAKLDNSSVVVKEKSVSVILLAGGKGKRMGVTTPDDLLLAERILNMNLET